MSVETTLSVTLDRDSVCMGDDTDPHDTVLTVSSGSTIADLLTEIRRGHYLASIAGGKATWLVVVPGSPERLIGVVAQQWRTPKLIVSPETPLTVLFADTPEPALFFRYWVQSDPALVFSRLQAGLPLPDRYSGTA